MGAEYDFLKTIIHDDEFDYKAANPMILLLPTLLAGSAHA